MTDKYTREQKLERLMELVPDLPEVNARIMLGYESGEGWVFARLTDIEAAERAVDHIEDGTAFTPLYKALK